MNSDQEYLNLAHQFLDTNFIESTKSNNFNILPVLSTNPLIESFVQSDPPIAVDYFSFKLTQKQYHNCWKNISNNQFMKPYELSNVDNITRLKTIQQTDDLMMFLPTTSQARLENACWRAWYKNLMNLEELNPNKINWFKENDVTVLYGPLIIENEDDDINNDNEKHDIQISTPCLESDDEIIPIPEVWNPDYCCSTYSSSNNSTVLLSSSSSSSSSENENENESDSDSILVERRYTLESTNTTISTGSIITKEKINNIPQLKSILKKRKNIYFNNNFNNENKNKNKNPKKRISFSTEISSVRFIV